MVKLVDTIVSKTIAEKSVKVQVFLRLRYPPVVELADTRDLKSLAFKHTGSNPVGRTNKKIIAELSSGLTYQSHKLVDSKRVPQVRILPPLP